MFYVKWAFVITFWVLVVAFFHYTLPQHDVARIADTYEKRIDFGENSIFWTNQGTGDAEGTVNRDVFFIQAFRTDDRPMIYRNEDTGWGWPPYFKFDTANLQAEANNLRSTPNDPQWAVITHYGWRNEFLSIYPNAISVRAVDGPDVRIIPWLNIVILTIVAAVSWAIWVRWRRFRAARIDPMLEDIGEGFDAAGDSFSDTRGRFRRWRDSWKRK
ncbi:DUF1523 family protein [Lutimaribacter sp. EGI FJ00015]|uniref:DUF1523 family protein n=1 Tax=Lutimaribacter degradans TaxID=2945989 RepID=A0ACC5ZY71_9RHOB|nr:DUF1523 family protein [Lutimaribacter sp. EGI FJ00013]MCM2563055.1 DUF1523 family protein [Lutimaribacter sp. EGI FJ00013]MCO0614234.1 DUF1523 family protein [Lutimaribacter sp. EGI FJ00015]MCO0637044.1 DUF1523 family protein [Lutimaribacter sp. EGI FJ00014]